MLSESQKLWLDKLRLKGYAACVALGWDEARDIVYAYLKGLIIYKD